MSEYHGRGVRERKMEGAKLGTAGLRSWLEICYRIDEHEKGADAIDRFFFLLSKRQ